MGLTDQEVAAASLRERYDRKLEMLGGGRLRDIERGCEAVEMQRRMCCQGSDSYSRGSVAPP